MSRRAFIQIPAPHPGVTAPGAAHRPRSIGPTPLRALVALVIILFSTTRADDQQPSPYQVKAVWLLNFVRFIEWPNIPATPANSTEPSPIVVGVFGRDPFGRTLEKAFEGKTVRRRPFTCKRVTTETESRECHLLFISASERRRTKDLLGKLKGAPILTVGETDEFLDQGGTINFLMINNSVRFEINLVAAKAAGLKLDPNLLTVAERVRGKYD